MSKKDLNTADIRSAIINILIKSEFPSNNELLDEASLLYQYNSELESGGHESFFRWQSQYIKDIGITKYLERLIGILKKIDAFEYANILEEFGEKMWSLYIALENEEIDENEFYEIIHEADKRYYGLNDKIYFLIGCSLLSRVGGEPPRCKAPVGSHLSHCSEQESRTLRSNQLLFWLKVTIF